MINSDKTGQIDLKQAFVARLERFINGSPKTQIEIAIEVGYANANILTMFKRGTTRLPLDKVVPMAHALDDDPAELLRLWFEAHEPGVLSAIEHFMGRW